MLKKTGTNQTLAIATFILEPIEKGTKFTTIYDYKMPWGVFGKFLQKLFAQRLEQKHQEKCLELLKSIMEK